MHAHFRVGLVAALLGVSATAGAESPLTQRDGQGPVTVAATLMAPPRVGSPIQARIALDTHSVSLDGVVFEQAVVLRTPRGVELLPTGVEGARGGGHHREATVSFPPIAEPGTVRLVVKNVGGVAERMFAWDFVAP